MPTVKREGPYDFVFFSSDRFEPAHIHVTRDNHIAKFWLDPVEFERNHGFPQHEINRITRLVRTHREFLLEAWHDYFNA
jgi:hypothetical protein